MSGLEGLFAGCFRGAEFGGTTLRLSSKAKLERI